MCALYLVFNGKVNNLGRSTSIAQVGFYYFDFLRSHNGSHLKVLWKWFKPIKYINNRKPDAEAFIEAEIYESASRNRIISRAWKSSGSNKWALDYKATTLSSIQTVLEKLNIQVENLLQFLPQEKVSTFNSLRYGLVSIILDHIILCVYYKSYHMIHMVW